MLAAFTKPLDLVTAADIDEVTAQSWPEGYEVEFKETLPHRAGGSDRWLTGHSSIGEFARDEILAEVIAFANSQGGSVLLGIAETKDNPPRAERVAPLPRVGELQRRFEDQARSCIEPPLVRLQIRAIETDGQGGGVVLFRTFLSRAAPHRLTTTQESYIRRGSSTMKMTTREIQDKTLNVARGLAGIDAIFNHRCDAFREWASKQADSVAYRITALPLVDLPDPGRIFGKQDVFIAPREFVGTIDDRRTFNLKLNLGELAERPRLRGVARSGERSSGAFVWELYQSGLTDLWISNQPWSYPGKAPVLALYHAEVLAAVANTLMVIKHYREYVGSPDAEYGIEVEQGPFVASGEPVTYYGLFSDVYTLNDLSLVLPRFSVGPRAEFEDVLSVFDIDLYDGLSLRRRGAPGLKVNI
jgi:hypothetical protein